MKGQYFGTDTGITVTMIIAVTTCVCEKNTHLEKNTCGKTSFQSDKSWAGEHFLLLDCKAKAHLKGPYFWHRHQYYPEAAERPASMNAQLLHLRRYPCT